MSRIVTVICNRALRTSRRVEQVIIPVFKCFPLTSKRIIVTTGNQVYLDMLDVANAWFEVSILFSALASVESVANIHPPKYVSIHFMPACNTATKHAKMDEVPRVFTHKPRGLEIPGSPKTQIWWYPAGYLSAVLGRNWIQDAQTRPAVFWRGRCR